MFDESDMSVAQRAEERLPKLAAVFNAGRVDFRIFATVAYRTGLIADPDVMHFLKPEPGTVCLFIECAYTPGSPICRAPY